MFSDAPGDRVGPAPWYWKTFPDPGAPYEWRLLKDARGISYPVVFRDANPGLQVAIYGRVRAADEGHLLLWGPVKPKGVLVVETCALAALKPLKKGSVADAGVPWIAAVRPLDRLQTPQA